MKMLVICAKSGQLGNRLLLFANFIAFAIENNLTVLNPAFDEYSEFFDFTSQDFLCCYPAPHLKIKSNKLLRNSYYKFNRYLVDKKLFKVINISREKPFNWSDSDIREQVKSNSITFFQGWLFRDGWFISDLENLHKHAESIRSYFTPIKKYRDNVSKLILTLKQNCDILIGVHIRQGDYEKHQNGRYFYSIAQYLKVMFAVKQLFINQKIVFLICSNVVHDQTIFEELNYAFANNHIIEDMYSLAECDYIIGPPSSYTMWASFYGNKPLYMIRDINKILHLNDFVNFYDWKGIFHAYEDWNKSFWTWTH